MRFFQYILVAFLLACGGGTSQVSPEHEHTAHEHEHGAHADEHQHAAHEHGHGHGAHADEHQHAAHEHGHGHGAHADEHQHAAHEHGHGDQHHQGPAPLVHRFENADDHVARLENPERDAWQKPAYVVSLMQIQPGMTVADIGAGTGYFLAHMSRAVGPEGKVLGLDIEPDMVRYMKERIARENLANVEAREVAGDDPRLDAGSADRILIVNTWHHIPARRAYAAKLAAGLAAGGALYIVDFHMNTKHGPPRKHRLPAKTVIAELEAAGLRAEVIPAELGEQYVIKASAAPAP